SVSRKTRLLGSPCRSISSPACRSCLGARRRPPSQQEASGRHYFTFLCLRRSRIRKSRSAPAACWPFFSLLFWSALSSFRSASRSAEELPLRAPAAWGLLTLELRQPSFGPRPQKTTLPNPRRSLAILVSTRLSARRMPTPRSHHRIRRLPRPPQPRRPQPPRQQPQAQKRRQKPLLTPQPPHPQAPAIMCRLRRSAGRKTPNR